MNKVNHMKAQIRFHRTAWKSKCTVKDQRTAEKDTIITRRTPPASEMKSKNPATPIIMQTPPQIQAKVNTVQAVISRLDDQKIKEPVNEKGSRKRQSEEGSEPARKATKRKSHSGKALTEKKRAIKAAKKA